MAVNSQTCSSTLRPPAGRADVLAGFLRELGVEGTDIPEGLDERARMYRAQLAGRRMLVVLDNATDEAQVRPLLPGSPGCAVLITSTSRLAALAGATAVALDLMPPGQATELLTAIIGETRAQAEPEALGEVARLCGYLPLALRIAGARLVSRPAWKVSWFATRLADESKRLDLLKAGDLEIRASFGLSYRGRAETEQRAFRMLGLLAADFPAWNLAAVLETDTDDAEELLEQLVDAVLADIAGVDATGLIRYRLHDLLRAFAKECLTETEAPGVREECLARLADQYIGAARLASALVQPGTPDIAAPARPLLMEDVVRGDPRGWFMAERASLVRLVEQAHAARLQSRAWQLAGLLPVMFDWRADWRSWEHTHQLALDAARQAGDADAEAGILRSLGALYRELGRYDEAVTMLTRAAAIFEGHADQHRRATVLRNLPTQVARHRHRHRRPVPHTAGLQPVQGWSPPPGVAEGVSAGGLPAFLPRLARMSGQPLDHRHQPPAPAHPLILASERQLQHPGQKKVAVLAGDPPGRHGCPGRIPAVQLLHIRS